MRAAAVFSDNMVLQREKRICFWGDAADGETVTVTCGTNTRQTIAANGTWRVELPPMQAADDVTVTITGAHDKLTFSHVAIGEVWLCGGQSNMEFEAHSDCNGEALLQGLHPDCGVRFYYTPKQRAKDAQFEATERNTCWAQASPEQSRAWSAVGLYFALELAKKLQVTVGLIGCNWGGTSASAWVPRETLAAHPALQPYLARYDTAMANKTPEEHAAEFAAYLTYQDAWNVRCGACYEKDPHCNWATVLEVCGESRYPGPMGPLNELRPGGLYETMLQRVCPYSMRGFLYYQGESDDHAPQTYAILLQALIARWRADWHDGSMPFLNVQLPMFRYAEEPDYGHWCLIREAQMQVYQTIRHTGLAVLTDCGELDNIHPRDKAPVGHRLALQALAEVYGKLSRTEACAPMLQDYFVTGNTMTILISYAADGFQLTGDPTGFELAGADRAFVPATVSFGDGFLTLTAPTVSDPCYARYAWRNYQTVTVFGKNGLPLAPFRTECVLGLGESL